MTKSPRRSSIASRPPIVRMLRIHDLLIAGKLPNCRQLSARLEVAPKTVQRDIDFMRDQLRLPIEYDAARHGFFYSQTVAHFPTVTVSEGELVALLVAQKALEQYRGTPFERPIASAFEKLASSMPDGQGISLHELADAFSFKPTSLATAEMAGFSIAAECVMRRHEISFEYAGLADGSPHARRLRPYHLGCISDQWYLVGFDPVREAIRTFALARMKNIADTKIPFALPENFTPVEFFKNSFSAFEARETERVRIRLTPLAARLASERKWHDSQTLEMLPDGGAELFLDVGIAPDLIAWILSWGPQAEILAPSSLRERVADHLTNAAKIYRATD